MANGQRSWSIIAGAVLWLVIALLGFVIFRSLGLGAWGAALLILAIVVGGRIDLPLAKGRESTGNHAAKPGICLNVGGGLIPLGIAIFQAIRLGPPRLTALVLATAAVATASYLLARPVAGKGIVLPWVLPALFGAAFALILAPAHAISLAFTAGTLGTFLGADILHLPSLNRIGAVHVGIGGAGPSDGLLWSGLLAAGMAGGF
jgi:uncharacterized membrane protein